MIRAYILAGEDPPDGLTAPEIMPGAQSYLDAWQELASDRQFAPHFVSPISFLALDAYARRRGIDDPDEFASFCRIMREMDQEYLSIVNKRKADA